MNMRSSQEKDEITKQISYLEDRIIRHKQERAALIDSKGNCANLYIYSCLYDRIKEDEGFLNMYRVLLSTIIRKETIK